MTMAISVERFLMLHSSYSSSRSKWFYIIPVLLMTFVLNATKFLEFEIKTNKTVPTIELTLLRSNEKYVEGYIIWFDMFFIRILSITIIPILIMVILNVKIIRKIVMHSRAMKR